MKKFLLLLVTIPLVGLIAGCVTQLKSDVAPGTDLHSIKKLYVERLPADHRGVERLIADRLNVMGYQATSGESATVPDDVDAAVTYQDKWMWDITMYMLQLDVQVRRPNNGVAIASGHVLRTSLARKSPPETVADVLNDIFRGPAR